MKEPTSKATNKWFSGISFEDAKKAMERACEIQEELMRNE